jgi:hypothetical protein
MPCVIGYVRVVHPLNVAYVGMKVPDFGEDPLGELPEGQVAPVAVRLVTDRVDLAGELPNADPRRASHDEGNDHSFEHRNLFPREGTLSALE